MKLLNKSLAGFFIMLMSMMSAQAMAQHMLMELIT